MSLEEATGNAFDLVAGATEQAIRMMKAGAIVFG